MPCLQKKAGMWVKRHARGLVRLSPEPASSGKRSAHAVKTEMGNGSNQMNRRAAACSSASAVLSFALRQHCGRRSYQTSRHARGGTPRAAMAASVGAGGRAAGLRAGVAARGGATPPSSSLPAPQPSRRSSTLRSCQSAPAARRSPPPSPSTRSSSSPVRPAAARPPSCPRSAWSWAGA